MKKRIVLIIDTLRTGGAQTVLLLTVQALSERRWQILVVFLHAGKDEINITKLSAFPNLTLKLAAYNFFDPLAVFGLKSIIRAFEPDIVQTHLTQSNTQGTLAASLAGVPCVAVIHSAAFANKGMRKSYYQAETFALNHFASRIFAVGNAVAAFHQSRFPHKKLDVICNSIAVPEPPSQEQRTMSRKQIGVESETPVILALGSLSEPKAYPDMFSAFRKVRDSVPSARLFVFGNGSERDFLQAWIDNAEMNSCITLFGRVEKPFEFLPAGNVFALSSHREGLPLAMLEAMSMELPVVATRVGEIPYIIDADCGRLTDAGNIDELAEGIVYYLSHPEAAQVAGQNGRKKVIDHYSLNPWIESQLSIFQTLRK